ncbi:SRPBCC family protein [Thiomonas sp.]|uniref:Polyketide cyclase / dehydrase and lipid transport n=1 Tax=mine drainage metagenome TaxID=410659 RepID=E6PRN9_9ZZZZ
MQRIRPLPDEAPSWMPQTLAVALCCLASACMPVDAATLPATPAASGPAGALAPALSAPALLQAPASEAIPASSTALAATSRCRATLQQHPLQLRLEPAALPKHFDMAVRFFAPVPVQMAWQAMTDYNAMASYIPGMERSEVLAADGDSLRVLQVGRSGIEPFRLTLRSTLDITLRGHVATWFTIHGNLDSQGRAEVRAQAGGSAVHYTAQLHPRTWLPPLLGPWFMRKQLQQQMTALRERMCVLLGEADASKAGAPAAASTRSEATQAVAR